VREHNFSLGGLVGFDVYARTIGVVGTGKIGRLVAQIFRGFGARVLAHDPFPDAGWAQAQGVEYIALDELLAGSDIVTLHLPLTPSRTICSVLARWRSSSRGPTSSIPAAAG
jgi:D-lactate dehydrogenase